MFLFGFSWKLPNKTMFSPCCTCSCNDFLVEFTLKMWQRESVSGREKPNNLSKLRLIFEFEAFPIVYQIYIQEVNWIYTTIFAKVNSI